MKTENLIYKMLTENTGSHMLDSGGAYGRNWQRNQKMKIQDFKKRPPAVLELSMRDNGDIDTSICVDLFHKLNKISTLDNWCEKFNRIKTDKWDGEKYYGTSAKQEQWLERNNFTDNEKGGDGFNTYNFENNFSQVLQGNFLRHDMDYYVLLQIHGGCDVRGGYTDAKLFLLDTSYQEHWNLLRDDCSFSVKNPDIDENTKDMFTGRTRNAWIGLDWSGEWITNEGTCADDEYIKEFARLAGCTPENKTVKVYGDINE